MHFDPQVMSRPEPRRPPRPSAALLGDLLDPEGQERAKAAAFAWGTTEVEAAVALGLVTPWALTQAVAVRLGARATALEAERYRLLRPASTWRQCVSRQAASVLDAAGRPFLVLAVDATRVDALLLRRARAAAHGGAILLAPRADFERFIRETAGAEWIDEAVHGLAREEPDDSSADPGLMRRAGLCVLGCLVGLAIIKLFAPAEIALVVGLVTTIFCLSWLTLRVVALVTRVEPDPRLPLIDSRLPIYTILCPLHGEAESVQDRVKALRSLNYPLAKLDVKFLVEADDPGTRAALERVGLPPWADVIVAPPCMPRTKPKALMLGLPFARGELLVVYDAEDRPHPDQLREAAETFAASGPRVGCLQAPLVIELGRHGRRPGIRDRFFAAEYDGLFRVLVPALASWRAPVALGGSSNHFRLTALRQTGGWDPFNVTEDADLGFRMARNGWLVGAIASPTYEETPATLHDWYCQRARWFKGWIQTGAVLLRRPSETPIRLGWRATSILAIAFAGALFAPLAHLVAIGGVAVLAATRGADPLVLALAGLWFLALVMGMLVQVGGLIRSNRQKLAPWLIFLPLWYLMLSLAALLAIRDLLRDPFHWRKTNHGPRRSEVAMTADPESPTNRDATVDGEHVDRFVALSRQVLASGDHARADVLDLLGRYRDRLVAVGVAGAVVTRLDDHIEELSRQRRFESPR